MAETLKIQKRQVAYKIKIDDILKGEYTKEDNLNPSYLSLGDGRQISRVNIIGIVIDLQNSLTSNYKTIKIDDGSGNINLRIFESMSQFNALRVGEPVLVIGRIREFADEIYIIPEIIRMVDKDWIELRSAELSNKKSKTQNKIEIYDVKEEINSDDGGILPIVRRLDKGDGADFNDIIKSSKDPNAEKILLNLIKIGELFEIKPGKIKILE
jgi:RPA family protein